MLQLVLAVYVSFVAVAVYGIIGLRWWHRARKRRAVLEQVAALDIEPYHAAALRSEATDAAAAELLLGGYLDIDEEGAAYLTEAGRDPARTPVRPLPAALLEAVRRHDPEPVSIGWIDRSDAEYQTRRMAHRYEQDTLLPEIPRIPRTRDGEGPMLSACCSCVGVVLVVGFWIVAALLLVMVRPHGVRAWAAAAVAAAGLAALWFADRADQAVRARTACEDPLGDRARAQPHPALTALDEEQRLHVLTSTGDHGTWRGIDRIEEEEEDDEDDEDDDWADEDWLHDWWSDAYHYRASDHDHDHEEEDRPGGTAPAP
ncbi:hypothetical protein ACWGE1_27850 [Streptomyces sp. NPDC054932]